LPHLDVLGWEWPVAWDECRAQGLDGVSVVTQDPRRPALAAPDPVNADADQAWRVVRVREVSDAQVELVICAEQWSPLVNRK